MKAAKHLLRWVVGESAVMATKRAIYGRSGEPFVYGPHRLRYLPGTGPVRLSYINSPDVTVRNDARQIQFFLDQLKTGDLVLDIGGHHGEYAVLFSSIVGSSGRVITFEPDPSAMKVLRQNLALNMCTSSVQVEQLALFDSTGTQEFYCCGGNSMSSLARAGLGSNALSASVTVETVATLPLDDYLVAQDIGHPNWIKLDTEGAEINVLRGMREVLKAGANIVCELHPYAWKEFGVTFEDLLQIVDESGRSMRYLDESYSISQGAVYGAVIIS